jgi:hypothetical protein
MRRHLVLVSGALAVLAAVSASCLAPTETKLVLTTDADCATRRPKTAIYTGGVGDIDPSAPRTVTDQCDAATGNVGTLVVVPESDGEFQVDVISAVDGSDPTTCASHAVTCIFSRRRVKSIAHTPLTLPIPNDLDCLGVECDPASTCFHGLCVDNTVDPNSCAAAAGCPLSTDGGVRPPAPDGAAMTDGSARDSTPGDTASPLDAPPTDASGADAPGGETGGGEGGAGDGGGSGDGGGAGDGGAADGGGLPPDGASDGSGTKSDAGGPDSTVAVCAGFSGAVTCPDNGPASTCNAPSQGCCADVGPGGSCAASSSGCAGVFLCCTGKDACGGQFCCHDSVAGTQTCTATEGQCTGQILCTTSADCGAGEVCQPESATSPLSVCAPGSDSGGVTNDGGIACDPLATEAACLP